jgi:hypothetical protein
MKLRLISTFCAWLFSLATGCTAAQELAMPSVPITVEAHVRDADGQPIAGATVRLALPRYRLGDKGQRVESSTNADGVATVSGTAQQDYSVSVEKVGYYPTQGPWRGINDEKSFQQYAVGVQKIALELRPVRNPIDGISKAVRIKLPAFDRPLGFDLEAGDWVAPFGNGTVPDLIFTVGGYFKGLNDYDQSLTLTFTNRGDGIVLTKIAPRIGSTFKFPYEAPLNGYEPRRVWTKTFNGKTEATNFDSSGETNYIIRVRTELDEKGNVRRALYGVIASEVIIGGNNDIGRNVSFTYTLNPDWTRNIEFDPAKVATASR